MPTPAVSRILYLLVNYIISCLSVRSRKTTSNSIQDFEVLRYTRSFKFTSSLKNKQSEIIKGMFENRECVGILPKRYGKIMTACNTFGFVFPTFDGKIRGDAIRYTV
jgi:hypothetical protein